MLELMTGLNQQGITIIMIEHIMRAVMGFCERIAVLQTGRKIFEGTPEEVAANEQVEKVYLGE